MKKSNLLAHIAPAHFAAALAITLCLPAVAQTPTAFTGSKSLADQFVKRVRTSVHIEAHRKQEIKVPFWENGSLVSIRFRKTGPQGRPAQPATVSDALAQGAAATGSARDIVVSLRSGGALSAPLPDFNGPSRWAFKVAERMSAGVVELENVSPAAIDGMLLVESSDSTALAANHVERQKANLQDAAHTSQNPDLLLIFGHTLTRHVQGYPGGQSEMEARLAQHIQTGEIKEADVRSLQGYLADMSPVLRTRAREPKIAQLSMDAAAPDHLIEAAARLSKRRSATPSPATAGYQDGDTVKAHAAVALAVSPATYNIRLYGVKSWRCADDVGWEWGCDDEEPFIVWTALGSNYVRVGRTESASGVGRGSEFAYTKSVNVLSASPDNLMNIPVAGPLLFIYQVIEDDPGGPTREQTISLLLSWALITKDIYGQNWSSVIASAPKVLGDSFDFMFRLAGKDDDYFPTML